MWNTPQLLTNKSVSTYEDSGFDSPRLLIQTDIVIKQEEKMNPDWSSIRMEDLNKKRPRVDEEIIHSKLTMCVNASEC